MTAIEVGTLRAPRRTTFFAVCLSLALLAFASLPLSSRVSLGDLHIAQVFLSACFLVGALVARRLAAARPYSPVLYALFAGSTAVLLGRLFGGPTLDAFSLVTVSPAWIALSRLSEVAWRAVSLVLLMAASGASLRSIYLARGRAGVGLGVGLAGFIICAALAFAPALGEPGARRQLLSLAPWIIVFALSNGFGDELLFRGLLLRRFEPFLGKGWSNVLAALAYTLLRAPTISASHAAAFVAGLFGLALAWGWLTQKSGGVWGSALCHAGIDCLLILQIDGTL